MKTKTMKKFLALFLAIMMTMAVLTTTAFAATATALTNTGSVTIANAAAGSAYTLYRVFDLSYTDGTYPNGHHSYITNDLWSTIKDAATSYVSVDDDGNVTVWSDSTATAQSFAAAVIAKNPTQTASQEVTSSGSVTISNLQYGYYIMASSRADTDPKYTVFTLCNSTALEIKEKNEELPSIEKKVNDKDSVSAGAYETLNYTITVEAAAGTDTYTIVDTLPAGISYVTGSLKVDDATANTDYTLTVEGQTITVVLQDTYRKALKDADKVVITYSAKLNSSATADTALTNTVKLDSDSDDKTDTATVYTGELSFNKYEKGTTTHLTGAKFVLKNSDSKFAVITDGIVTDWASEQSNGTTITTAGETITIKGLNAGTYDLVETKAPDGYTMESETTHFSITVDTDTNGNVTKITSPTTKDIYNAMGIELPATGGIGTTVFYVIGAVLVLGAGVLLVSRKRRDSEN